MGESIDFLLLLSVLIAGLEAALFVFRDTLLRTRQGAVLEGRIESARGEVGQARDQVEAKRAELATAEADLETARAALQQAESDLAEKRRPREVLVHRVANGGSGPLFQARLGKVLPATAEENQTLLWSYDNVVELQARDAASAQKIGARVFAAKAGYTLGPFERAAAAVPAAPRDAAA